MKLLILDSGHAEYVSGKQAPDKSMREWEFNNDMQYRIKKLAEQHGISVYLTNPSPAKKGEMGLTKRAQLANSHWRAKGKPSALFFSIHANAHKNEFTSARGVETFVAGNASSNSKKAARYFQDTVYNEIKSIDKNAKNRGVKVANFTVIYKANMPAILAEYAFYSNRGDLKILKENREELAIATVKSICKYFNIKFNSSSKPSSSKPQPPVETPKENKEENKNTNKQYFYKNCIVYDSNVDKDIAKILEWKLKDSISIELKEYKDGLGEKIYVVGGACNKLKGDYNFCGKDRWDTLNLVKSHVDKI